MLFASKSTPCPSSARSGRSAGARGAARNYPSTSWSSPPRCHGCVVAASPIPSGETTSCLCLMEGESGIKADSGPPVFALGGVVVGWGWVGGGGGDGGRGEREIGLGRFCHHASYTNIAAAGSLPQHPDDDLEAGGYARGRDPSFCRQQVARPARMANNSERKVRFSEPMT